MDTRSALTIASLAVVLAGCSGEPKADREPQANPDPMPKAAYMQAVAELERFAATLTKPAPDPTWNDNANGRLVAAARTKSGPVVITLAASAEGQGQDVCLQARRYGTPQVAFLELAAGKPIARTTLPVSAGCDWFLENPDAVPSPTEIVDFGAGDVVFDEE